MTGEPTDPLAELLEMRARLGPLPERPAPSRREWLALQKKYIRRPRGWRGLAVRVGWWFESWGERW